MMLYPPTVFTAVCMLLLERASFAGALSLFGVWGEEKCIGSVTGAGERAWMERGAQYGLYAMELAIVVN